MPQSEVVMNQIKNYDTIREIYSYEVFIEDKLPHRNEKPEVEYSNKLNIAGKIHA